MGEKFNSSVCDPIQLARPEIARLIPYEGQMIPGAVKLDANENPFPWPQGMKEALFQREIPLNRYPDGNARELKRALSAYTKVSEQGILVGNGSDEIIQILYHTFGGDGKAVLIHPPTFSMYKISAAVTRTGVVEVPLVNGIALDMEKMLAAGRLPEVSIIIICNPNNPTGSLYPKEQILKIVRETGKIVVVDEAYAEFSGESLLAEIPNYPNLLIMRTFSKAFGLAGLRLGYLLGQSGTIDLVNRAREPFNVNTFSQEAGIQALHYWDEYQKQVTMIKEETQKIYNVLAQIPDLKVYETHSNFILFQPQNPDTWAYELLQKGFLVRNMGNLPVLGKALRVSTGLPEENRGFLQAVREVAGLR